MRCCLRKRDSIITCIIVNKGRGLKRVRLLSPFLIPNFLGESSKRILGFWGDWNLFLLQQKKQSKKPPRYENISPKKSI